MLFSWESIIHDSILCYYEASYAQTFLFDMFTSHVICMLINSTINAGSVSFIMHVHSIFTWTLFHFPFTHSDLPTILPCLISTPASASSSLQKSNDGRAFTVFISFKTNTRHSAVPTETFDGSELCLAQRAARLGTFLHAALQDWSRNKKVRVWNSKRRLRGKGWEKEEQRPSS